MRKDHKCRLCRRQLKSESSIRNGFGAICMKKIMKNKKLEDFEK